MQHTETQLKRATLDGREFDDLIPKVTCENVGTSEGFTDHSIVKMKECVKLFSWQMSAVSKVLQRSSLNDTVWEVFGFMFDDIEYLADDELQVLRSPACSWYSRRIGIDCKSFSIIASSLFTEMGITHYIRKTRQRATPQMWEDDFDAAALFEANFSHVYIVVPFDQQSGKLDSGYYVCDGTVATNEEFTDCILEIKDEFMSGMPHVMLNGVPGHQFGLGDPTVPATTTGTTTTGSGGFWSNTGTAATNAGTTYVNQNSGNWAKKISFKNIAGLFQPCIGGTAFNAAALTTDMTTLANAMVNVLNEMNDAADKNNMLLFSDKVNEYFGMADLLPQVIQKKIESQDWNGCSRGNLLQMALASLFYYNGAMHIALDAWLAENFTVVITPQTRHYSAQLFIDKGIMPFCAYVSPLPYSDQPYETYTKKAGQIKGFIPNDYVYNYIMSPEGFNPQSFISGLSQLYTAVQNPGAIFTGGTPTNQTGTGTTIDPATGQVVALPNKDLKNTNEAGMGTVIGVMAALALGYWALNQFGEDKPANKPKKT